MAVKYVQLAGVLRSSIEEGVYQPGAQLPTEMQLARLYQVSRQTVRQALALLAEEGIIEKRQGRESRVTDHINRTSRSIAVVSSYVDDYIFPFVLHSAEEQLEKQGYSTHVYSTQNQLGREREIMQELLTQPIQGLLVEGVKAALPNPNIDLYRQLQKRGVSIVFMYGAYPEIDAPCIADDDESGGYMAVQHLVDLGHSRIGGIFKSDDIQGQRRYFGFLSALRDRNLPFLDAGIQWYSAEERRMLSDLGLRDWLERFVQVAGRQCTAIVCYNDIIAHSLIQVLLSAGYRVPEDIAVCSFDNSYYSDMGPVPITSLANTPSRIGSVAAAALVDLIQGRPAQSQLMDWQLVRKKST